MALGKCRECGRECAKSAKVCPGCGVANPVKGGPLVVGLSLVLAALFAVYFIVTAGEKRSTVAMNPIGAVADLGMVGIYEKVAADAVAQYGIAKRTGSAADACAAAMGVVAAYQQGKDEPNYIKWRAVQKADCTKAGMPTE